MDLNLSWFLGVIRDIVSRREAYSLVHVHCSGVYWPLLCGILVSKWMRIPLVLTVHCSLHATYHAMSQLDAMLLPFSRWVERCAIRRAARTIVLTTRSMAKYREMDIAPPDRFVKVPDCIDVESFANQATPERVDAFRHRHNVPSGRTIVAFVGRIAHEKGWQYLVAVARELNDRTFHFLICGDGNERDLFESQLQQEGLRDMFTFTGFVPCESVALALSLSSVVVMTSLHEEFGGAMIEGMVMAKPVVAFEVGGLSETLKSGEAGCLVPFGDVVGMAKKIREVTCERELATGLGMGGRLHVEQLYGLDAACDSIRAVYDEVMKRSPLATKPGGAIP